VLLDATNNASEPRKVTLELDIHWAEFSRAILSHRETGGHRHFAWDTWTRSLAMEITTPVGGAALAVASTETLDEQTLSTNSCHARLGKVFQLLPGETQALAFYFAVAQERDGLASPWLAAIAGGIRKMDKHASACQVARRRCGRNRCA
jgi:hypothetical protein